MPKFNEAIPEAIRNDEAFKGIDNTGDLATAFHTRMNQAGPTLLDQVPEELRASTALKEAGDVGNLAKQFIDQQAHLGNALRIPSENASDEDRQKFAAKVMEKVPSLMFRPDGANADELEHIFRSLGKPEAQDKYAMPEGVKIEEAVMTKLSEVGFKNNMSNKQLTAVVETIIGMNTDIVDANNTTHAADFDGLSKEWGSALDSKMANVIKLAEATKAPAGLIESLKSKGANSETYKWLDTLATSLTGGESINFNNDDGGNGGSMTPSEAKAQISEVMGNLKHPYRDKSHPQHQDWIKPGGEMTKLMKMANPAG